MHVRQIYLYVYTTLFSSVPHGCYVFVETSLTKVTPHIYTSINRDMICVGDASEMRDSLTNKAKKTTAASMLQHGFKVESDRVQSHDPTSGAHTHAHTSICVAYMCWYAGAVVIVASKRWSFYEANLSFNFPKTCSFHAQSSVNICWIFSEVISPLPLCLRFSLKCEFQC